MRGVIVAFTLLSLLENVSALQELNVTITANYTPAPDEVPGKLDPNEFTAGSVLGLNCLVQGKSNNDSLEYSWALSDRPSTLGCTSCYPVTSSNSPLHYLGVLHLHLAGNYTCSVSEISDNLTVNASNFFTVKVVGAGVFASGENNGIVLGPLSNNGLIVDRFPRIDCLSNSSLTGQDLGTITTLDGTVLRSDEQSGDLRLHNPFTRPGALRFELLEYNYRYSILLRNSYQGVYTCTIPDSNGLVFSFNIGMYHSDFNELPTITILKYDGKNQTLNCVSTGSVATIVSWTKDGVDINIDGDYYSLSQTITDRRSSTYSNVLSLEQGEFTTGNYSCTVSNALGKDTTSIVIIGAPEMFTAVAGEREVVFSWSPPPVTHRNGIITSYSLSCSPSPSYSLPQSLPSQLRTLSVTGFSPNTQYSCSLVALNRKKSGPRATTNFTTTKDYSFFQLSFEVVITNCFEEITSERSKKLEKITSAIIKVLTDSCRECVPGSIDNQFFTCDSNSPSYLIYRARIEGSSEKSSSYFVSLIEDWVRDGASVIVTGVLMTVDNQCSINITSLNSGLKCSYSPSHSSIATTGGGQEEDNTTTAAIVGGIVAVVITLTIIGIAVVVVCLALTYCGAITLQINSKKRNNMTGIGIASNDAYNFEISEREITEKNKEEEEEEEEEEEAAYEIPKADSSEDGSDNDKIEEESLYENVCFDQ